MQLTLKLDHQGADVSALTERLTQRGFLTQATSVFDTCVKTAVVGFADAY